MDGRLRRVLLVSLYRESGEPRWLDEAEWVVGEVERVLGRPRGGRIGEAEDRDGQYFHYLAMWMYALGCLGEVKPDYRQKAVDLARQVHRPFLLPGRGVWWKMREDLSGPYQRFLRLLPLRRRVRPGRHHPRHGMHLSLPGIVSAERREDGGARRRARARRRLLSTLRRLGAAEVRTAAPRRGRGVPTPYLTLRI